MSKKNYLNYSQAQKLVCKIGIVDRKDYRQSRKTNSLMQERLPGDPRKYYLEWQGWDHFLFKGKLSYESARQIVNALNIKSKRQYEGIWKSDSYFQEVMPYCPRKYYPEWQGWGHYLGYTKIVIGYKKFMELVDKYNVINRVDLQKNYESYNAMLEPNQALPFDPEQYYKIASGDSVDVRFNRINNMPYLTLPELKFFFSYNRINSHEILETHREG